MKEQLSHKAVLGRIIKLSREAAGVSISVLSKEANLPVVKLEKIEGGRCDPYASDLVAIARVLGLDAALLIEVEGRAICNKSAPCCTAPGCGDKGLIMP